MPPRSALSTHRVEVANLVLSRINPVDTRVIAVTSKGGGDLTEIMSAPILDALSDPDTRWVPAAETGAWHRDGAPLFAVMSQDATAVRTVGVYTGGLVVPARGSIDELPIDVAKLGGHEAPAQAGPRTDAAIVLSSTENALFVIGGRLEDGTWPEDLRVYSVPTGRRGPATLQRLLQRFLDPRRELSSRAGTERRQLHQHPPRCLDRALQAHARRRIEETDLTSRVGGG